MKIGVFDSGIGGKSIADKLTADFPDDEIVYVDDRIHVPYGGRKMHEIIQLTEVAIQPLFTAQCDIIVLACNTATVAAIEYLRDHYPNTPFVGLEPMIKPATALTKSGVIAICATPFTLKSERYLTLKNTYGSSIRVLEPDCSKWADMIEHNTIDESKITQSIEEVCNQGADVIVLACTHYHWIHEDILKIANGRAIVIDPSDVISKRVGGLIHPAGGSRLVHE